jgi:APA family basic amino acid/polyamine antiporter
MESGHLEAGPASGGRAIRPVALSRALNRRDGVALVVGTVIGSGIFLVPGAIARQLDSLAAVMLVWGVGGVLSVFGALSLGELGSAYPSAGGIYVYLQEAYGRAAAFLYGWVLLTMIQSGSIATLAVGFSIYALRSPAISQIEHKSAAISCILFFTGINCFGIQRGRIVQGIVTVGKVAGLALMIGLLLHSGHVDTLKASFLPMRAANSFWLPFGVSLVAVFWAYEGWHVVSFTAAEFNFPNRDLPMSLLWGTLTCSCIYMLSNIAYYAVLTPAEIRQTDRPAATAVTYALGGSAATLVSVLVVTSILGAINGMVLTGPRVYYAMARDGLFLPQFARLSLRHRTPTTAIVVQGIWASVLTLIGSFQQLFTYVIFSAWIFYGLAVAGVIVLRIRQPDHKRPFLVPVYPWIPISFVLAAIGITLGTIINDPRHALYGICLVLAGLPIYAIFRVFPHAVQPAKEDA